MKPRDIQRSVRLQRVERSAGDAPSIGRVGRVPGTGLSKGIRRRRRRGEGGRGGRERNNRKKVVMTWSALFVALVVGVLGIALWIWVRSNRESAAEEGMANMTAPAANERVASRFESPTEDEALDFVKQALLVRDPAKVAKFFRLGTASAETVIGFLRSIEGTCAFSGYEWLSSMDANGLLIDGVVVNSKAGGTTTNRLALMTPDEKGAWKIDFEAFARIVVPSWSDLLGKKVDQGVVRVVVAKDSYFNGPFKDDAHWICYGMVSPDIETVLLGYCRKDSPQAAAMARIVSDAELMAGVRNLNRATLELRRRDGAETRQFEITRVLAEDWVMSGKPFDENFK